MDTYAKKSLDSLDIISEFLRSRVSRLTGFLVLALIIFLINDYLESPIRSENNFQHVNAEAQPRKLATGMTVADQLRPDAPHTYELTLSAHEHFYALVDKGDLNLMATLCVPGRETCDKFVSWRHGPLEVAFTADKPGLYRLEIRSLEVEEAGARSYILRVNEVRVATVADEQYDLAVRAFAEAEELRGRYAEEALRRAISKYLEAAVSWEQIAPRRASESLRAAGDIYFLLSDYQQALTYYRQSLETSQRSGDVDGVLDALNSIGYTCIYLGENRKALSYATKVHRDCRRVVSATVETEARRQVAQALNSIGEIYYSRSELQQSLQCFSTALDMWTAAGDRRGMSLAHLNMGYSFTDSGDLLEATEHYRRSLDLSLEVGDRRGEALARTALGGLYSFRGEKQRALDAHAEALVIFRAIGNHQGEAAAINGVAQAYEDLSDYHAALGNYQQALELYRRIGNRDFVALNEYYIGRVYFSLKDAGRARESYQRALALSREVGDRQIETHVLKGLGIIYSSESNYPEALKQFRQALDMYGWIGDRRGVAYTLNDIGYIYYTTGELQKAFSYYQQALPKIRDCEDRRGEALILDRIARLERKRGNLDGALALIKDSINIIEASRVRVDSKELRTSYFATAHKHYELYIDLLMQLHRLRPDTGYATAAFLASEHARSRSLLDMLTGEKLTAGQGLRASLLKREQELQQLLEAKTEYRLRLLGRSRLEDDSAKVAKEIHELSLEYEAVQSRIRQEIPRYATFTQPNLLNLEDIQAELRDQNTLLLELSLGDERSYLWAVGPDQLSGYELPARTILEGMADKVYNLLTKRQRVDGETAQDGEHESGADGDYFREAATLSEHVLGPVATQLGSKRLLIVADGALQYIPFDALPVPGQFAGHLLSRQPSPTATTPEELQLLIAEHEIVGLPSASILVAIRRERVQPSLAGKFVAVLADPVFDKDDPRVRSRAGQDTSRATELADDPDLRSALRDFDVGDGSAAIPRLPGSLREAKAIMAVVPPAEGAMAVGFDANRTRVMSEDLRHYRIIHFATHGILNNEQPELSGLILSLVNEHGSSQNGYLRLRDIYNLDLPADLVVLSACQSGLGRNVRGEGLVGLTRGFIYAGSKSVVASLWKVDDEATAELMKHFYSAMVSDGLPPSAALKAAKRAIRAQDRWRSPYFWAGFVLHGEYSVSFAVADETISLPRVFAASLGGVLLFSVSLYLIRRRRVASKATPMLARARE